MKLFGFSRKGFLYIDNGNNLISQQTTSGESQMLNDYCTLMEYDNFDDANAAYNSTLIHQTLKPKLGNIESRFQEDEINAMYEELDNHHTGF